MARSERLYPTDIIEATEAIERFVAGRSLDQVVADDLIRSEVLLKLINIGETAARLIPELKERYPETEWRRIIAFRNIAAHEYFAMNWSIAWVAATENTPRLASIVRGILDAEFPAQAEADE